MLKSCCSVPGPAETTHAPASGPAAGLSSLPEGVLFEQVCADVSSIQISDFTTRPDVLQTEDPCPRDVSVFFGLDHDDETGVHWN